MEHFPRCVRQAWDSAEEPQEPEVRQLLRSVNPKEWQLPCYPTLGELSPDEEDFNREMALKLHLKLRVEMTEWKQERLGMNISVKGPG